MNKYVKFLQSIKNDDKTFQVLKYYNCSVVNVPEKDENKKPWIKFENISKTKTR